jgi:hypothetical protein
LRLDKVGLRDSDRSLDIVTSGLSYFEFTICDEAQEIDRRCKRSAPRLGVAGVLSNLNDQVSELEGLLPVLTHGNLRRAEEIMRDFQLPSERLKLTIDGVRLDIEAAEASFKRYVESSEDWIGQRLTFSPVSELRAMHLDVTLRVAHPYKVVKRVLEALQKYYLRSQETSRNLELLISAINTALREAARTSRIAFESSVRWLSFLAAIFAPVLALTQLFPNAVFKGHPQVDSAVNVLVVATIGVLFGAAIVFFGSAVFRVFSRQRDWFALREQEVRDIVDNARSARGPYPGRAGRAADREAGAWR